MNLPKATKAPRNDFSNFEQYYFNNFSNTDRQIVGHRVPLKAFSYQTSKLYTKNDINKVI